MTVRPCILSYAVYWLFMLVVALRVEEVLILVAAPKVEEAILLLLIRDNSYLMVNL